MQEIDIKSVFTQRKQIIKIIADLQGNEKNEDIDIDQVDELDLPKEETYLRCDIKTAEDYLWEKEYKKTLHALDIKTDLLKERISFETTIYSPLERVYEYNFAIQSKNIQKYQEILMKYIEVMQEVPVIETYSLNSELSITVPNNQGNKENVLRKPDEYDLWAA